MKRALESHAQPFTSMLAKIGIPMVCFTAWVNAASPGLNLVKESKVVCEVEVLGFHAETRPGESEGNEIRDFDLELQVKESIKGTLPQGQKVIVKGIQARPLNKLARPYEGDENFSLWSNRITFRDYQEGAKYLVLGSSKVGETSVSRPDYIQAYDALVESDVKSVLGIDGMSPADEVGQCSALRVYTLAQSAAKITEASENEKKAAKVKALIKKCRKEDLLDLANKLSEDLLFATADGTEAPAQSNLRRQFFLASFAEVAERIDDEQLETPRVKALVKRHSSGVLKIKREDLQGAAPQLSDKANRWLEKCISE